MRLLTLLSTLPLLLFFSTAYAFQIREMDSPASFIVGPSTGVYYVSNVSGSPGKKDNNAFIAKIDPGGKLTDRNFIRAGKNGVHLNAPGMVFEAPHKRLLMATGMGILIPVNMRQFTIDGSRGWMGSIWTGREISSHPVARREKSTGSKNIPQ